MNPRRAWRRLLGAAACALALSATAQQPVALQPTVALAASPTATGSPRGDFFLQCGGCHRFDGRGSPRHGIPDFRESVGWFTHLPEGREYLVRVPGSSQSQLTDAELALVLNWMLRSFSAAQLPADFVPYTTEEVTRARRPAYEDIVPVRHGLANRLAATGKTVAEYSYGADRKP